MLNLFPIQFLAPLAYMLLRLCVGLILVRLGITHIHNRRPATTLIVEKTASVPPFIFLCIGLLEIIAGVLIFLGLYTQLGALIVLALSAMQLAFSKRLFTNKTPSRVFYVLLFFVSLSLFITGAGAFAFDLPI